MYGSSDQLLNVLMLAVNGTTPVRCKVDLPLVGLCSPPLPVKWKSQITFPDSANVFTGELQ